MAGILIPQGGPISINEWPYLIHFGRDFRPILMDLYNTISESDMWCFLKVVESSNIIDSQPAYILRQHRNIQEYNLSDAEFIIGLQIMIQIAKRGWNYFRSQYTTNENEE